ncbi:MAG: hypothetical protein HS122_18720 [Opitutaceae bacterium]|nr:hypothetical protein [Opitutaceae bacterium]
MSIPSIRLLLATGAIAAGAIVLSAQEVLPTTGISLSVLGKIAPRSAAAIHDSPWSIGAETMDRDFTVYDNFKRFLGPLGAKGVRLQAGWAKCEKAKGVYSWAWLDAIVDDATAQGVKPWLEFSYGNPVYPGGGDTGLGGGFPSSPEALAAWDAWVRVLVLRYRDRVDQWEVWNEPDLNSKGTATAEAYVDLYIRTATIVRQLQPSGKIWALALAHVTTYADQFLAGMKAKGRLGLVDAITFHGYPRNPDDMRTLDQLHAVVVKYGRPIELRQGETGAPSRYQDNFALRQISFTETTQAKWDLRRLLAYRARDVPMNLFTLCDMHYTQESNQGGADGVLRMNHKGLLATRLDQTVDHVKPAYSAVQGVFTIFDSTVERISAYPYTASALRGISLTGYRDKKSGDQVAAFWFNDAPPADGNGVDQMQLSLPSGHFTEPVLVDLRTSTVYALAKNQWTVDATGIHLRNVPVYDSPLLLAERSLVPVQPLPR